MLERESRKSAAYAQKARTNYMAKKRKKKSNQFHAEIEHDCNYEDPRVLNAMIRRTYQQFTQRYKENTRFNERMDYDPA